jgi:hypothetical protein
LISAHLFLRELSPGRECFAHLRFASFSSSPSSSFSGAVAPRARRTGVEEEEMEEKRREVDETADELSKR